MEPRLRELLRRQGRGLGRLKFVLESILVVAGILALIVGVLHHLDSREPSVLRGEGRRVVAFRQVTNRICTENLQNQRRALTSAATRVERLGFAARALGWDVRDLESVSAPPSRLRAFVAEVRARRDAREELVALQMAVESDDAAARAAGIEALSRSESEARELSLEAGIVRCVRMLPPMSRLLRR